MNPDYMNSAGLQQPDIDLEEKRRKKREYMRKYNATEKGKAYNQKNVKEYKKKNGRKSTRSISAEYREMIVDFLIKRDGLICGICKHSMEGSKMQINHRLPVALGGKHILENVELAHPLCNEGQSAMIRKQARGY